MGGLCLKSGQVPERLPRRERVPARQELAVERGAVQGALAQTRALRAHDQPRGGICCTAHLLPSGSAKNTNRPHGKS